MKRITDSSLNATLPAVRLYLEDLDQIVALLKTTGRVITIKDEDHEYESFAEVFDARGPTLRNLDITAGGNYASVGFAGPLTHVHADPEYRAMGLELVELLRRRIKFGLQPSLKAKLFIIGLVTVIAFVVAANRFAASNAAAAYVVAAPAVALAVTAGFFVRFSSLHLSKRHQHQTFFKRHEENIIRGLISLGSALAGAAFGYWLRP
jgi:hypothetical protein